MSTRWTGRRLLVGPVVVIFGAVGVLGYEFAGSHDPASHVLGLAIKPAAAGGNGNGNNGNGNGNNGGGNPAKTFAVSGTVSGLAPGVTTPMPLRLQNPNNQPILVQTLTVTATGGSLTCPNNLVLLGSAGSPSSGSISLSLRIAANGSTSPTTAPLDPQFPVKLSPNAPDACQSFTWSLKYSGTAVQG